MPQKSKRKSRATQAVETRWTSESSAQSDEGNDKDVLMDYSHAEDTDQDSFALKDKIDLDDIGDLFELVKNNTSLRSLSTLIYLSITYFGVTWRKADLFLRQIGSLSAQSCNKWGDVFIEGDLNNFLEDNRGGKQNSSFFDIYPELENMAKLFTLEACKRKSASFTALELAQYLDKQYYELTGKVSMIIFW